MPLYTHWLKWLVLLEVHKNYNRTVMPKKDFTTAGLTPNDTEIYKKIQTNTVKLVQTFFQECLLTCIDTVSNK